MSDHDFSYFFFNPARVDPPGRAEFQNYKRNYFLDKKGAWILLKETKMVKHVYPLCPPTS
jgi:hypothetical protein